MEDCEAIRRNLEESEGVRMGRQKLLHLQCFVEQRVEPLPPCTEEEAASVGRLPMEGHWKVNGRPWKVIGQ